VALRVARGLFRLWIILSVLWIGGVGVTTWLTIPSTSDVSWDVFLPEKVLEERVPHGPGQTLGHALLFSLPSFQHLYRPPSHWRSDRPSFGRLEDFGNHEKGAHA